MYIHRYKHDLYRFSALIYGILSLLGARSQSIWLEGSMIVPHCCINKWMHRLQPVPHCLCRIRINYHMHYLTGDTLSYELFIIYYFSDFFIDPSDNDIEIFTSHVEQVDNVLLLQKHLPMARSSGL